MNRETSVVQQTNGGYAVAYKKATFGYDNAGRVLTIGHYSSSTNQVALGTFSYDAVNRLTGLTWTGPSGPFGGGYGGGYGGYYEQWSWNYDSDSRASTINSSFYSAGSLTYTYDHDSQLTNVSPWYGGGYGGGYGGTAYSWDANGDSNLPGTVRGAGNRLLSDGTYDYTFDISGHVTKRVNKTSLAETDYAWDNRGRMISVKDFVSSGGAQTQEVDYTYDVFNRLITRVYTPYTGGNPQTPTTARFVYDGNNVMLAFNGNQALTDRYLWGPAVDQILADEQFSANATQMPTSAGNLFEVLGDNEWNVRDLVNAAGVLQAHFVYDAFGKLTGSTGTPIRFMHNGTFYDSATGLEYHSADGTGRWYNAADQRWMSEDPDGLGPDTNPYRYVDNSPTNGIDPSGTDITLEQGNDAENLCAPPNNLLHQQIGVDIWDANGVQYGKRYFSLGAFPLSAFWGTGYIYRSHPVHGAWIIGRRYTTIDEDRAFLKHMEDMVGDERPYSVFLPGRWNCRDFSQDEFYNAPGTFEERRVKWTPKTGPPDKVKNRADARQSKEVPRDAKEATGCCGALSSEGGFSGVEG